MYQRPFVIGAVGLALLAAALGLLYWTGEDERAPAPAVATAPAAPTPQPAVPAPAPAASVAAPTFDIVRVDPQGNAVIAGKSKPNAIVTIMDGDKKIGEVKADERGEWVFVPDQKLPSGSRILTLESQAGGDGKAVSDDAVVVVIPEKGKDIAGRPSVETEKPLAMVVPRDQASPAPTTVLQAPPVPAEPKDEKPRIQAFPEPSKQTESKVAETAPVTLDVIDYDDKGEVVFSGKAQPGDKIQVYVDDKLVARTEAGSDGAWSAKPDASVSAGTHRVRVDKVRPDGSVLARIELPFVRAAPFVDLPQHAVVIIQPGNNLWRIASRVYGSGFRYTEIYAANSDQIRDPDLIYPGQVFGLPKLN